MNAAEKLLSSGCFSKYLPKLWNALCQLAVPRRELDTGSETCVQYRTNSLAFEAFNRTRVEIVLIDLDLSLTFAALAETSRNPITRKRNLQNARQALALWGQSYNKPLGFTGSASFGLNKRCGLSDKKGH